MTECQTQEAMGSGQQTGEEAYIGRWRQEVWGGHMSTRLYLGEDAPLLRTGAGEQKQEGR